MLQLLSRSLRRLVTPKSFLVALGLFCLASAAILHLHNSFRQFTDESILDLRPEGYNEADVKQLLHAAGAQGRQQYLYISLLDLGVYMWCYSFLLAGLLTMAGAVTPFEAFKWFNLLPALPLLFDVAENSLVLSMLLTYPDLVDRVAPILPAVSKCKWMCLYMCACLVGGSGAYCLAVAAGLAGKQRRGGSARSAAQQQPQPARQPSKKQTRQQAGRSNSSSRRA